MNDMVIIPKSELIDMIRSAIAEELKKEVKAPRPAIRGINGLAEALNCSVAKAFQLKKSGNIRFFQDGKLVLFDYDQVLQDLKGVNINKRGRKATNGK